MQVNPTDNWDDFEIVFDSAAHSRDLKKYSRTNKRVNYNAEVIFAVDDKIIPGIVKNISVGGASIAAPTTPAVGEELIISIPFVKKHKNVRRKAIVRWAEGDLFGIQFK